MRADALTALDPAPPGPMGQSGRRGGEDAAGQALRPGGYLYAHVTSAVLLKDLDFHDDVARGPGDPFPDFDLPTTDDSRFRTRTVLGRRPLLLFTSSITCPMAASAHPMLKRLHAAFGRHVEFVMLYVREAHPGEHYDQTSIPEVKLGYAQDLKTRDALPWTVAVDDPSGTVHRLFDEKPNTAYLADRDGEIVFRSLCAGDEHSLAAALQSVARGERPHIRESRRRLGPLADGIGMLREMTRQAGPRAEWDVWRAVPPVAALAWIADLYRPLPPRWRTVAAVVTIGSVAVGIAPLLSA